MKIETEFCDLELADEGVVRLSLWCFEFALHILSDSSEESFFIVPPASTSLNANMLKEIKTLNDQVVALQHKLQISEGMRNEQEEQLRERIELARREVNQY